ncbi:MAG TPA: hypothetical protein VMV05_10455 [bacterium]|nr:hypothetical protein [bacterium]
MNKKCILDTNKYVSLALGKTKLKDIKNRFSEIYLNEFNVIEVIAKTYPSTFRFQQGIAQFFEQTNGMVETLPNHQREIWGLPTIPEETKALEQLVKKFLTATNYKKIEDIVVYLKSERDKSYKYFVSNVTKDLAVWKKQYSVIRKKLPDELKSRSKKENFKLQIFQEEYLQSHLLRTRTNAYNDLGLKEPELPNEHELNSAQQRLLYFLKFYAQYLTTSIETQPSFNDRADVSLTHYLGDGFSLITAESKILNIAKEIQFEDLILNIK